MKFIYHNLKMLSNRMHNNSWVLGELFVVFIVLWYLCDSIGCLTYIVTRPQGADFSHIYEVQLIKGEEPKDTVRSYNEKVLMIRDRLHRMTEIVEAVGMHYASDPMGASNRWGNLICADTVSVNVRLAAMDEGMMKVFRLHTESGRLPFATMPATDNYMTLTREAVRRMQKDYPSFTTDSLIRLNAQTPLHVYSVLSDFRPGRFIKAEAWGIERIDEHSVLSDSYSYTAPTLMIRVYPDADRSDFPDYFMREIAPVIGVDNVMVLNLLPYSKTMDSFEQINGDRDRLQIHSFIALFLLVNVFMGIVGTFWYRTRRRRNEIALRLCMGSTSGQIRCLLLGEGLILLTIAAIPAAILCLNVALAEPTVGNSPLIAVWIVEWNFFRYLLGISVTWILMASMIVFGIWIPATRAMKIQPADALHEE